MTAPRGQASQDQDKTADRIACPRKCGTKRATHLDERVKAVGPAGEVLREHLLGPLCAFRATRTTTREQDRDQLTTRTLVPVDTQHTKHHMALGTETQEICVRQPRQGQTHGKDSLSKNNSDKRATDSPMQCRSRKGKLRSVHCAMPCVSPACAPCAATDHSD
jgi:hypothetical protein